MHSHSYASYFGYARDVVCQEFDTTAHGAIDHHGRSCQEFDTTTSCDSLSEYHKSLDDEVDERDIDSADSAEWASALTHVRTIAEMLRSISLARDARVTARAREQFDDIVARYLRSRTWVAEGTARIHPLE